MADGSRPGLVSSTGPRWRAAAGPADSASGKASPEDRKTAETGAANVPSAMAAAVANRFDPASLLVVGGVGALVAAWCITALTRLRMPPLWIQS